MQVILVAWVDVTQKSLQVYFSTMAVDFIFEEAVGRQCV